MARMMVQMLGPTEKAKYEQKDEKLVTRALEENDADASSDCPDRANERAMVFGPDKRLINASGPRKLPEGCFVLDDY